MKTLYRRFFLRRNLWPVLTILVSVEELMHYDKYGTVSVGSGAPLPGPIGPIAYAVALVVSIVLLARNLLTDEKKKS